MPEKPSSSSPRVLNVLTLNCWGLKYISKHRSARLALIGETLASLTPSPSIVALQECWTQADYRSIRQSVSQILPYAKFYYSGIFGSGLAIFSAYPIVESRMHAYSLNGRPQAFFRGDWYVGKGVASARINLGGGVQAEVFNTHLHAPYGWQTEDSYATHRVAQAWEIARLMRDARDRGSLVIGMGDFNSLPNSLVHKVVVGRGSVFDAWIVAKPDSVRETADVISSKEALEKYGTTCDSRLNSWRWSKNERARKPFTPDPGAPDAGAKRLDYIFFSPPVREVEKGDNWGVKDVKVGMTGMHPGLECSLSDHFSVEASFAIDSIGTVPLTQCHQTPQTDIHDQILFLISSYRAREEQVRKIGMIHLLLSPIVSIGCLVGIWWTPSNWMAFVLALASTLALTTGILHGLIAGLFTGSELRLLQEFEEEVREAKRFEGTSKISTA
ncbi:putative sphingomyelinase family protein [Piedraia hortae CBS 480.64]|uniref:Putative sphingomyelinase family protein n=1 Tax=Piedraia hortae CBS 480.64 TaxID=1314780 RepID=A0A6A7C6P5_9PEZI|nr:putative sphingomyelinase family protein [Piedraia hortae CBS 480.64]